MDQFNNIIEFRQAIYDHGLTKAKDTQFELVDALLLSPPIRSFPELSLSPVFRRQWPSVYTAIEDGGQDVAWLERYFVQQIPATGVQIYALDVNKRPMCATHGRVMWATHRRVECAKMIESMMLRETIRPCKKK